MSHVFAVFCATQQLDACCRSFIEPVAKGEKEKKGEKAVACSVYSRRCLLITPPTGLLGFGFRFSFFFFFVKGKNIRCVNPLKIEIETKKEKLGER